MFKDVVIYWGVGDIDRTDENRWNPDFIGTIGFSNTFDLSPKVSQQFLKDVCDDLKL
jgi:hypothetical protein